MVHDTLKDCRGNERDMSRVLFSLAGNFRQTLSIIPRGTAADAINACLKASSTLWPDVKRRVLTTNMRARVSGDPSALEFSRLLLMLGKGRVQPDQDGRIGFPANYFNMVKSLLELKNKVFLDIQRKYADGPNSYYAWLCERAILAPTNRAVNAINANMINEIPGQVHTYTSVDTTTDMDDAVDFLNSFKKSTAFLTPSHKVKLKVGTPIILLRNLDAPKLCNGTQLGIKKCMPHVIEATILAGCAKGEDVFIPRIPLIHDDKNPPLHFKRLQFPVRISFPMTINKSQCQSLQVVGINLEKPCFSHGQLYVACSRVGSPQNLYILALENKTVNVVYQNALQ
ncbi:uncharacterized protein LOC136085277 [Hydra vulgaris]|uniref:ATP-dependent DNA helicase n=1 Tax=Hydra vulgaris TaxID=6087 RepID=A0ABM4CLH8_HYDVU